MDRDETPASPAAIRSWAPYGMRPWMRQENVSRMLAVLRGSRSNRVVISRAIAPVVMIAIVLLAVHRLDRLTSPAMLSSAPLFPLILRVRPRVMKSRPPFTFMTSSIPPASRVTMIRSLIPPMPVPMASIQPVHESLP